MAHEILSVKLCQLDDRVGRLHSRIHMSETAGHSQLSQEIAALRRECAASEMALREELRLSKSEYTAILAESYGEVERAVQTAKERLQALTEACPDADARGEADLLLAEYGLDFAHQAADRALLQALEAIDTQTLLQTKEESSTL